MQHKNTKKTRIGFSQKAAANRCCCSTSVTQWSTHGTELLSQSLGTFTVVLLGPALLPLCLVDGLSQPLHLGPQLAHIPLQLPHLALPLRLAAGQLQTQLMPALLQQLGEQMEVEKIRIQILGLLHKT